MEESERQKYETASVDIRAELKRFEADFAKQSGGKKPGREDIKQNPIIGKTLHEMHSLLCPELNQVPAQKYKRYNEVRDILSGKIQPPPPKDALKPRKRKSEDGASQTPSKRSKPAQTPSKTQPHSTDIEGFETPSVRRLFSPAVPTSIGPTPQKDGRVLGLFDLLVESDAKTPSRSRHGEPGGPEIRIQATPSKRTHSDSDLGSAIKLGRTPISASKRMMLDTFLTPLKNRDGNAQGGRTPTSVSKLQFSTPAFLKRAPLAPVDENGLYKAHAPLRLPRKPLGRGLSSVVASLRKLEEDKLDEELEALHEMENECGDYQPPKPSKPKDDILVPDSQGPQLLGGFDDEGELDSDPEQQLDRGGQPLRIYKKKGQKRTTRKSNMKPTRSMRPQENAGEQLDSEGDEVVPETQAGAAGSGEQALDGLMSDSDFEHPSAEGGAKKKADKAKDKKPVKEGPIKKATRKISAMANQNFKRLKLKNHGAKGGPGIGSRFRRRR